MQSRLSLLTLLALALLCLTALSATVERHRVTNPTTGVELFVQVARPQVAAASSPALVLVPGGRGDSSGFFESRAGASDAELLAEHGFVVVAFDPDGRGQSGGVEDDNGFAHQDGLAAVIRFVASEAASYLMGEIVTVSGGL